ncbi:hypothetical protein BBR47_03350 [Brevibacillus brevis NBRC 100599]|uniref:Uncharacterized protein n=1 Tax=Brevibacillus brevis (strain 47 / JCM 6285 / NBRC 100599) TaxID=358681 RepID=C0ZIU4_BREBN|nr:hypothetical protein BBR47_03350 [Brevibacillus brevis NBRC 100599]
MLMLTAALMPTATLIFFSFFCHLFSPFSKHLFCPASNEINPQTFKQIFNYYIIASFWFVQELI